jgi:hypothetical protein
VLDLGDGPYLRDKKVVRSLLRFRLRRFSGH